MTKDKKNKNGNYSGDPSEMRKAPGYENAVPGVNSPEIAPPAYNPPVPNRAHTEMSIKNLKTFDNKKDSKNEQK